MKVVKTIKEVREIIKEWKDAGYTIGLVPTMGYLHAGHGSLIKKSSDNNDKTVVSVFVNPTQFGANEDIDKYPRDIERDKAVASEYGADIIFNPEPSEMYPGKENNNFLTTIKVERLGEKLCGITRPTHFAGVTQVVSKLFNIVEPHNAYFGLKDLQQYIIIKKMVEDLNFNLTIHGVDIVREESGLAMSSRNTYLNDNAKEQALCLSKALNLAKSNIEKGITDCKTLIDIMKNEIEKNDLAKIDYIKIVSLKTLDDIEKIYNDYGILLAVYVDGTRLIDNMIFE